MKALGKRIKELHKTQGLSQESLSYEADIPLSQVGRIERGEINPTVSSIAAIAHALKTDLKDIFSFRY